MGQGWKVITMMWRSSPWRVNQHAESHCKLQRCAALLKRCVWNHTEEGWSFSQAGLDARDEHWSGSMLGNTNNVHSSSSLWSMVSSDNCFKSAYRKSRMLAWGVMPHWAWIIDPGWGLAFSIPLQGSSWLWRHQPPCWIAIARLYLLLQEGCDVQEMAGLCGSSLEQHRFIASRAPCFSQLLLQGRQAQHWPSGLSLEPCDNQR